MKNPFKNDKAEDTAEEIKDEEITEDIKDEQTEEAADSSADESDKIKSDYETLNAQYIRLAADFENYRKRQEAERENLLRFGTENALKKMLEVLDNFERAEKSLENIEDYTKYKESFQLLHK